MTTYLTAYDFDGVVTEGVLPRERDAFDDEEDDLEIDIEEEIE